MTEISLPGKQVMGVIYPALPLDCIIIFPKWVTMVLLRAGGSCQLLLVACSHHTPEYGGAVEGRPRAGKQKGFPCP